MVKGVTGAGKLDRFAPTPWTKQSEEWLGMDRHLAEDHLARHIAEGVDMLDLGPFWILARCLLPTWAWASRRCGRICCSRW